MNALKTKNAKLKTIFSGFTPYHFCNKSDKGFTLIELLTVIGIISLLIAVVLVSLNSARNKSIDASVKSNLVTVGTQAGLFFDGTVGAGTYGTPATSCNQTLDNGTLFGDRNLKAAVDKADTDNGASLTAVCSSTASTYMVAVQLSDSSYWCVDSTGIKKTTSRVPVAASDNTCP